MRREFAVLCDLAALCSGVTLSVASDAVQKRIDAAIDDEHRRSFLRTCKGLGVRAPAPVASHRREDVKGRAGVTIDSSWTSSRFLSRAKMVAVTAITAARTAGALDACAAYKGLRALAAKKKKKKKRLVKEWAALGDDKTCEECDALDGTAVNAYRDFELDADEEPHAADYHGESIGGPPLHPNCFPSWVKVAGSFSGGFRAKYAGELIELKTRSGRVLSVTPNHSVLTADGWIAASEISPGDYLASCALRVDTNSGSNPAIRSGDKAPIGIVPHTRRSDAPLKYEDDEPTSIDQVFRSLEKLRQSRRVDSRAFDLDGDERSFQRDVDVVGSDVELLARGGVERAQSFGDFVLVPTAMESSLETSPGGLHGSLDRSRLPAHRRMSGFGLTLRDGRIFQPKQLPLDEFRFGLGSKCHPALREAATERRSIKPHGFRELIETHPGAVQLDQLLEVRRLWFAGHVFDLQAAPGWFLAEGVIVSNCRCDLIISKK